MTEATVVRRALLFAAFLLLCSLTVRAQVPAPTRIPYTTCIDRVGIEALSVSPFVGVNQAMTISGTIRAGMMSAVTVPWVVLVDGRVIGSGTHTLAAGTTEPLEARWVAPDLNPHTLDVVLDADNTLQDCERANNTVRRTIGAPQVTAVTLTPTALLAAGTTAMLLATLSDDALVPITVRVVSNNPSVATVRDCAVPAGQLSCGSGVRLVSTVTAPTSVVITASVGGSPQKAVLNVTPVSIASMELSDSIIKTVMSTHVRVQLSTPPTAPVIVSVTTSRPDLLQAGDCNVPANFILCVAPVTLSGNVTSSVSATITASLGASTKTAALALEPAITILSVLHAPALIALNSMTVVEVHIASAAATPLPVDFTTSRADLIQIPDCTIQAGQTGCQVLAKLLATVAAPVAVAVTASISGIQKSSEIYVMPIAVEELTATRSANNWFGYSATIRLNDTTDRSFPVAVSSSHPATIPDFTITVPTSSSSASVSAQWSPVAAETSVMLSGGGKTATLVIPGPPPGLLSVSPIYVQGPLTSAQQINLGCALPYRTPGPVTFPMTSSHPTLVSVPSTITLTGTTTNPEYFSAQVNPFTLTSSTPVTLTVGTGASAKTATVWLTAP